MDDIDLKAGLLQKEANQEDRQILTEPVRALSDVSEVFQKPRDDYIAALMYTLAKDEEEKYESMLCYLGNVNVKPVSRLLRSG